MQIQGVSKEVQERFDICCKKITTIIKVTFPEIVEAWEKRDPGSFEERVFMTMYMEMIHAGFFDKEEKQ